MCFLVACVTESNAVPSLELSCAEKGLAADVMSGQALKRMAIDAPPVTFADEL